MSIKHVCTAAAAVSLLGVVLAAADNRFAGTWKLNAAESKFAAGSPSTGSATVRVEAEGKGLKATVEGVDGQGHPINYVAQSALDGTPGTITGSPMMNSVETKQVNDHTITAVTKMDGKVVYNDRRVISKDGKTLTITRTGLTADGKQYSNTLVLDKQ
jgi:hypothetical protein